MMLPIARAKATGKRPRRTRIVHQSTARAVSAFGRTAKNFHSLRSRRFMHAFLNRCGFDNEGQRRSRYHSNQREAGIAEQGPELFLTSVARLLCAHSRAFCPSRRIEI